MAINRQIINIISALAVGAILAFSGAEIVQLKQVALIGQKVDILSKEFDAFSGFMQTGERFTSEDGERLTAQIASIEKQIIILQTKIASLEQKKLLSRGEYSQFIDFLKLRFAIVENKIEGKEKIPDE